MNEKNLTQEVCDEAETITVENDTVTPKPEGFEVPSDDTDVSDAENSAETEPEDAPDEPQEIADEVTLCPEPEETVESLKAELDALRRELEEKRAAFERMSYEITEFSELFPTVSVSSIPDSVWESVKSGIPLSASYALYEKKTALLLTDAKKVNQKNSALSTGPLGREPASDFFSPDEVKAMSRDEVRKNYSKIMESMKKWN